MDKLTFDLPYSVVPAVRMTQKTKYTDPAAKRYLAWKDTIGYELRSMMSRYGWETLPEQTGLEVDVIIFDQSPHTKDLDNQAKAVCDAMNKIVYPDDRWVDRLFVSRVQSNDPMFSVEVRVLEGGDDKEKD